MSSRVPWVRPGVTLPELILVAWLFLLVLLGLARFAGAQGRLSAMTHDRTRTSDVTRTVGLVLGGELRYSARPDYVPGADSIRLRAVRGSGSLCGRDGAEIRVRYRGLRQPDPAKDSVLLVTSTDTHGFAHGLAGAVSDPGCGQGYRLTLDPEPAVNTGWALIFESGSYHISGGALRYRRGGGGRQPVTEAILERGSFRTTSGGFEALLVLERDSTPRLPDRSRVIPIRVLNPEDAP